MPVPNKALTPGTMVQDVCWCFLFAVATREAGVDGFTRSL